MKLRAYEHKAQYYETDQMGIIHHSNYIRWFESARIDYMNQIGISYKKMEEMGIISPVLSVECQYREMVHFDETVHIRVELIKYNGIKMEIKYTVINATTGKVCTTGKSCHCFLDSHGKILSLKKQCPDIHQLFLASMEENVDG